MNYTRILENKLLLPLSDWIQILLYVLVIPFFLALPFLIIGIIIKNDELYLFIIIFFTFIFSFGTALFYYNSYVELKNLAKRVSFFHFLPSWRDLALHMIRQIYVFLFFGFIFSLGLVTLNIERVPFWIYWGISILMSIFYQSFLVIISMKQKNDLLTTAQDEIKPDIAQYVKHNHPNSHLINEYRFAEIKPASLFLSAGVMSWGWKKNICLISRYFQWKLTDNELIAVISHEEGHITYNNIIKSYIHIGIDTFLRIIRFFSVFIILFRLNELIDEGKTIFSSDLTSSILIFLLIILVFISSGTFYLFRYYRVFLIEIKADSYGANLVGFDLLANTLRKLPSLIPSPIGYNQSSFLGFRVALLRDHMKT